MFFTLQKNVNDRINSDGQIKIWNVNKSWQNYHKTFMQFSKPFPHSFLHSFLLIINISFIPHCHMSFSHWNAFFEVLIFALSTIVFTSKMHYNSEKCMRKQFVAMRLSCIWKLSLSTRTANLHCSEVKLYLLYFNVPNNLLCLKYNLNRVKYLRSKFENLEKNVWLS